MKNYMGIGRDIGVGGGELRSEWRYITFLSFSIGVR